MSWTPNIKSTSNPRLVTITNLSLDTGNNFFFRQAMKLLNKKKNVELKTWSVTHGAPMLRKAEKAEDTLHKINQTRSKKVTDSVLQARHNQIQSAVANYIFVSPCDTFNY